MMNLNLPSANDNSLWYAKHHPNNVKSTLIQRDNPTYRISDAHHLPPGKVSQWHAIQKRAR